MIPSLPSATLVDEACREQLSPAAFVAAMVRFEVALARAQAAVGAIPPGAAAAIEAAGVSFVPDVAAIERGGYASGTPVIVLLEQLRAHVRATNADAAAYVHRGATSQDAIDTAAVLCVSPVVARTIEALERARDAALQQAERHAADPVLARTLLQAAGVTTFGCKAALWAAALDRTARRLRRAAADGLAVQLGGAVGDGAAFGERWDDVRNEMGRLLDLPVSPGSWQATRDGWADLLLQLGLSTGVTAKIAGDVALMAQTEVGEVREPSAGRGRSSAMPHKHNPVLSMRVRACAHAAQGLASGVMTTLAVEHERGLGTWQAEMALAPSLAALAGTAAGSTRELLAGLRFDTVRARRNIDATGGLVFADRALGALAALVSMDEASTIVERACEQVRSSGQPLPDVLAGLLRERHTSGGEGARMAAALGDACDVRAAAHASTRAAHALIARVRAGAGEQVI